MFAWFDGGVSGGRHDSRVRSRARILRRNPQGSATSLQLRVCGVPGLLQGKRTDICKAPRIGSWGGDDNTRQKDSGDAPGSMCPRPSCSRSGRSSGSHPPGCRGPQPSCRRDRRTARIAHSKDTAASCTRQNRVASSSHAAHCALNSLARNIPPPANLHDTPTWNSSHPAASPSAPPPQSCSRPTANEHRHRQRP